MKITKLGHACLLVEEGDAKLLFDPGAFSNSFEELMDVDAVMITHQHPDHLKLENLKSVQAKNPNVKIYADEGSVAQLGGDTGLSIEAVHAGEEFDVAGVSVKIIGTDHAVIHPTLPGIPNVGYFVAKKLFVPGDNFTIPGEPVDVLAVPDGGPWMKISEAIDYMLAVRPEVAFPLHDAVLAMPTMHQDLLKRFAEPAGVDFRVVENGQSTEV